MSKELKHYGMPRRSGRYPWGSGEDPYQRTMSFMSAVRELRARGLNELQIATGMGLKTSQLRARITLANAEIRSNEQRIAMTLKDKGYSNSAIGRTMGKNESSVRSLLNPVMQERASMTRATTNMLKESVDRGRYIDVGLGTNNNMGVSQTRLKAAIAELREEGYKYYPNIFVEQVGKPGAHTTVAVLGAPDTTYSEVAKNKTLIQPVTGRSDDMGRTFRDSALEPVKSISSDTVGIRYKSDKDGVIELRRGVDELNLGNSSYAQVRIGVDDTHYLKGMAVYSDDLPKGINVLFNTNKSSDVPMMSESGEQVLKKMVKQEERIDPNNPFGASIKREGQRGALNVVTEEGDWGGWSRTLSSQLLSKQPPALAKQQLDMNRDLRKEELSEIMTLTNPVIKRKLLDSFADGCDASAAHLEAAGLPRQRWHVILPVTSMKDNEVYAPNYNNGETVVLIRYPHGGKFEIPQLTVNNNQQEAKSILGRATDGIGINANVAKKLSGADFDGDTVIVIPNPTGAIKSSSSLKGLENFDPIEKYRLPEGPGLPKVGEKGLPFNKQSEMGSVSNLITDMTIKGAGTDEIAAAVRHSMVVIDAEKHNLNFRQSRIDNRIASLKETYQGSARSGASTIISKSEGRLDIPEHKPGARIGPIIEKTGLAKKLYIDPETGEKLYTPTGATRIDKKTGKEVLVTTSSGITPMGFTPSGAIRRDAHELSSGTPIENIYATHANALKALANEARKASLATKNIPYSPSAKKTYAAEVAVLRAKLNDAEKNKPLERQAQILANATIAKKKQANPGLDGADLKKIRGQALNDARLRVGAKKNDIVLTPKEWAAIQAGAVAPNTLIKIINNTELERVKELATPRSKQGVSSVKAARVASMAARGYSQAEIADQLGISTSTIADILK